MTLKSENALLLTTRNQVVLQGTNKSFQDVHLNAKVYWISTASQWNSTTVVILAPMLTQFSEKSKGGPFYVKKKQNWNATQKDSKKIQNNVKMSSCSIFKCISSISIFKWFLQLFKISSNLAMLNQKHCTVPPLQ